MNIPFPRTLSPLAIRWYARYLTGHYLSESESRDNLKPFTELKPGDIVIDAGANVGRMTFLATLYGAEVHSFEPNPFAFAELKKHFGKTPGIHLHEAAVADQDGHTALYFHKLHRELPLTYSTGSSTIQEKENVSKTDLVQVATIDLANFIVSLRQTVTLLKMDIEGAEVDVIPHLLRTGATKYVKRILLETHESKNPALAQRTQLMQDAIDKAGYSDRVLPWH